MNPSFAIVDFYSCCFYYNIFSVHCIAYYLSNINFLHPIPNAVFVKSNLSVPRLRSNDLL